MDIFLARAKAFLRWFFNTSPTWFDSEVPARRLEAPDEVKRRKSGKRR